MYLLNYRNVKYENAFYLFFFIFKVLKMAFGDWELFRMIVVSLRELEVSSFGTQDETSRSVRFTVGLEPIARKGNCDNSSYKNILSDPARFYVYIKFFTF